MTLNEYIKIEVKCLQDFRIYWEQQVKLNPTEFPKEMNDADWIDQYHFWQEFIASR